METRKTYRKRLRSAARTQNSPNVKPFDWRLPLRANILAVCSMSLTVHIQKEKRKTLVRPKKKKIDGKKNLLCLSLG